ncbi:hypothetical protein ERK18_07050 [Lactobacillus kimbladii]|uniref:hypothetical protein n=1 Tax=Lactobacillus kimbladii TaxID=1218506 RepID=UPI00164F331C|nr:hypothetical protein [Lactobacillus kimbladii]MBC6342753.1 hypothetical protein [Lactobacillus kimbladii]
MQYKKPFYKKWWFWLVIAVITVFTNLGSGNNETENTHHSTESRSAKVEKSSRQKAVAEKRQEEKARKLAAKRKKVQAKKLAAKKEKLRKKQLAQKQREKRAKQLAQRRRRAQKRQLLAQKRAQAKQAAANDRNSRTVYVAPTSGKRYHFDPDCRGLRPANGNITQMPLKEAISEGYTLCKWED